MATVAPWLVIANWSDQLDFGMLWVAYESENDSAFFEYRNNDMFQLQLRYNFQM